MLDHRLSGLFDPMVTGSNLIMEAEIMRNRHLHISPDPLILVS